VAKEMGSRLGIGEVLLREVQEELIQLWNSNIAFDFLGKNLALSGSTG